MVNQTKEMQRRQILKAKMSVAVREQGWLGEETPRYCPIRPSRYRKRIAILGDGGTGPGSETIGVWQELRHREIGARRGDTVQERPRVSSQ